MDEIFSKSPLQEKRYYIVQIKNLFKGQRKAYTFSFSLKMKSYSRDACTREL